VARSVILRKRDFGPRRSFFMYAAKRSRLHFGEYSPRVAATRIDDGRSHLWLSRGFRLVRSHRCRKHMTRRRT
jgi:hypothetical protein